MFKKLTIISIIAVSLMGCGGTVDLEKTTAAQKEAIGKIATQYLIDNPEFLISVSNKLQKKQQEQQNLQSVEAVKANIDNLINDASSPFIGASTAKVTVIEFFDYQCVWCAKLAPEMKKIVAANPNVKFVSKETPVFGNQWEVSNYAASMAQWIFKEKGSKGFEIYHNGVFETGHNEGKLTKNDVDAQAIKAGVDVANFTATNQSINGIKSNFNLFDKLGFTGTPSLVVMNTANPTPKNIKIINGFDVEAIKSAIKNLK